MYFQQILQGIASNLMESNLFKLKKQYIVENVQVGAGQLGIFTEAFSTICGTGFLRIPGDQFNLSHWSFGYKLSDNQDA